MIIDKLITLFGFEIDEKTLLRYKKLLKDVEQVSKNAAEGVKHSFDKVRPTVERAEHSVEAFRRSIKATGRAWVSTGAQAGRVLVKMGHRINRTASNLMRFRNLVGISIAGFLGFREIGAILGEGLLVESGDLAIGNFGKPEGETDEEQLERVAVIRKKINNIALQTKFGLKATEEAWVAMTRRGMDAESFLQGMLDSTAKYGGTVDDVKRAMLQLGQGWAKNKLQGQDLKALLETKLPILKALTAVTRTKNMTDDQAIANIQKMSREGKITRAVLTDMFKFLKTDAAGSTEALKKTMGFVLDQLGDFRDIFRRKVSSAGFFGSVKVKLQEIARSLGEIRDSGRLDELAEKLSGVLSRAVQSLWDWTIVLIDEFERGVHWTQRLSDTFGGFANTIKVILGLVLLGWFAPLISLFLSLGTTILMTVGSLLRFIGALTLVSATGKTTTVLGVLSGAFTLLKNAIITFAVTSTSVLRIFFVTLIGLMKRAAIASAVFMLTPIGRVIGIIGALIGAGVALYKNWDEVLISIKNFGTYLSTEFPATTEFVVNAFTMIKNAVLFLLDPMFKLWDLLSDLPAAWETVKDMGVAAFDAIHKKVMLVIDGMKWIADHSIGAVGKFLGETAAKAVENVQNSPQAAGFDVLKRYSSSLGGALLGKSPLKNSISTPQGQGKTNVDNGTVMNVDIAVQGKENDYDTGRAISQALTDEAKRVNINSTTTVKY